MRRVTTMALFGALASLALAQGGDMLQRDQAAAQATDRAIATYLDGPLNAVILTPANTAQWPLKLEAGQVVVAEARSEAFDPVLEIADAKGKGVAVNDDRYPGDQRPLLFWRCPEAGSYSLRLRCFDDKAGGRGYVRYRIYDSVDLAAEHPADKKLTGGFRFLVRIPMKAGQIEQIVFEAPNGSYARPVLRRAISPIGLPDINLTSPLDPVIPGAVMAAVDGDYYVVAECGDNNVTVRGCTREFKPATLAREGGRCAIKTPTNVPTLWVLPVKAGELLELSAPELNANARLVFSEVPDISKFDLSKPEANPFAPQQADKIAVPGPAWVGLPARAGDPRYDVFVAQRDTKLWVATDGVGPQAGRFTFNVKPAAADFAAGSRLKGDLMIARTDYWAFDARAGDVMALDFAAKVFAWRIAVYGPDLGDAGRAEAGLDQSAHNWQMMIQRPGRYVVSISCRGDGGGGTYSLAREVFHAIEFGKGKPAKGEIADGKTQVWKFTAKPGEPLYIHWWSSRRWSGQGSYALSVRNENGDDASLPMTDVGDNDDFGVINVSQPTTYLLVLTSNGPKVQFAIDLTDLPGYVKKK